DNEPVRLNHQNAVGTTTCFFFSVAYHWTKNREKKVALPSQPITFQWFHSMPRKLALCHRRLASQSISSSLVQELLDFPGQVIECVHDRAPGAPGYAGFSSNNFSTLSTRLPRAFKSRRTPRLSTSQTVGMLMIPNRDTNGLSHFRPSKHCGQVMLAAVSTRCICAL